MKVLIDAQLVLLACGDGLARVDVWYQVQRPGGAKAELVAYWAVCPG
jgi:hypothetical protein